MMQPFHHGGDGSGYWSVGDSWAGDQYDGQVQAACGLQLCQRSHAARVFGDDMGDGMGAHQGHIRFDREGAAIQHHFGNWQRQSCVRRIDKAQKVEMLRLGGKGSKGLFAYGKKDAGRAIGQGGNSRQCIGNRQPVVARLRQPRQAFMCNQRNLGHRASLNSVAADLAGKRVGCIHQMGDLRVNNIVGKAVYPAIAAKAGGQRLFYGVFGAPSVGKDGVYPCVGKGMGKGRGLGCATQKKDAHYG